MLVKVVGIQRLDFKNKDGEAVKGTNIFYNGFDPNVEGFVAEKVFIPMSIALPPSVVVGSELNVEFNRKGKLAAVSAPTSAK